MNSLELSLNEKVSWLVVGIATIIFVLFIMIILPKMTAYSEEAIGVESSPDTEMMYSEEDLYDIADSYGEEGRRIYVIIRWTFDVIWPLVYLFFLLALTIQLAKPSKYKWIHKLYIISIVATGFDYLENTLVTVVMVSYPKELFTIGTLASIASLLKWGILSLAFLCIFVIIIARVYEKLIKK